MSADHVDPDGLLELEDEPGPDRFDDRGSAALLALRRVGEVAMLGRVHVRNRAAAGDVGNAVAQQVAPNDQHARRARAADELVRAEEDRVLVRERIGAAVHVDVDVGRGGGEVPERQRAVPVQQGRDRVGVADDSGDVARRGERADLHRAIVVADEFRFQRRRVDVAVGVLRDDHDVGDRLAPRQLVGVVLERSDEHDRPLVPQGSHR